MYYVRPKNEEELQKREAIGTIRASRFVRRSANLNKPVDIKIVYEIHKIIFEKAWPEVAGVLRTEEATITDSSHMPPHYARVPSLMLELDKELKGRIEKLKPMPISANLKIKLKKKEREMIRKIIKVAAWIHHKRKKT